MSEALARIFAIQQREINEQERRRQLERAKHMREVAAFQNSGLPDILRTLADVPCRKDVQQRIYKNNFSDTTWDHCKSPGAKDITCMNLYGGGSGPRWLCVESPDSGRMRYIYNSGVSVRTDEAFDRPDGPWLDAFLEYAARACDPEAVAQKMAATPPAPTTDAQPARRRLQAV